MADVLHRTTKELRKSIHTPDFPTATWIINPDLSGVQGVSVKYWKITGDVVSEMTQAEKDAVDDDPAGELGILKTQRYLEIDTRTQELIAAGFVHDSKTFSLSLNAQHNWHSLLTVADKQWLTFPVTVSTFDNDEYSLANVAALDNFAQAGFNAVFGHLTSGRDLKKQIFDATTKAAVDAVVDTR